MSLSCFPTNYLASIDCTNAEKNYFQEVTREGKAFSIMKSLLLLFNSGLSGSSLGSLLFLGILGEELLVAFGGLLGVGPACAGISLDHMLATETLLGDHTLDLGGLVDSLVSTFDFAGDNVSGNIILLLVKTESLDDVSATLGAKTVSTVDVGDTFDVLLALLDNSKEDSGNVGADNATAYGLALAVTVTTGNIARTAYSNSNLVSKLLFNIGRSEGIKPKPNAGKSNRGFLRYLRCLKRMRVRVLMRIPCFIWKPCLSLPPVILKM